MVVDSTYDEETNIITLDHTWQEINDAIDSGKIVILQYKDVNGDISGEINHQMVFSTMFNMNEDESGRYSCQIYDYHNGEFTYFCPTANDYPHLL